MNRTKSPGWRIQLVCLLLSLTTQTWGAKGDVSQVFTLEGELYDSPTGSDPYEGGATIKVRILDSTKNCTLYAESQHVDTTSSSGVFNIEIGSIVGDGKRIAGVDSGHTMAKVFQNLDPIAATGGGCGGTYTPALAGGQGRYLRISVTPDAGSEDVLGPDMYVGSVPTALVSQTLQGIGPDGFLQLATVTELTQANLEEVFSDTNFPALQGLLAGVTGNADDVGVNSENGSLLLQTNGTTRAEITNTGDFKVDGTTFMVDASNNRIGVGTGTPSFDFSFAGTAAKTLGMERSTVAGSQLAVSAGGAVAGGTNLNGGDLYLKSGISTGTGGSNIYLQTATPAGSSGSADNSPSTKVTLLGNGNVGIGTTSPNSKLVVTSDSTLGGSAATGLTVDGASNASTQWAARFRASTGVGAVSEIMAVRGDGRVGIGTINPSSKFVVTSDSTLGGSSNTAITTDAASNTSSEYAFRARASTGVGTFSEIMTIRGDGNVGIGTTSPSNKLQVEGADSDVSMSVRNSTSTSARYPFIMVKNFQNGNGGHPSIMLDNSNGASGAATALGNLQTLGAIIAQGYNGTSTSQAARIDFLTEGAWSSTSVPSAIAFQTVEAGSTSRTERMRIMNNGNVGIGKTPTTKLDVDGVVTATGFNGPMANAGTMTQTSATTYGNTISSTYSPASTPAASTTVGNMQATITTPAAATDLSNATLSAMRSQVTNNNTSTLASMIGHRSYALNASTGTASVSYGSYSEAGNSSTGTITNAYGLNSIVTNSGGGTVTSAVGLRGEVNNSSGNVSNAYGILSTISGAGTTTNGYGVYIGTNSATNRYGLYQASSDTKNYFAGNVGIGTATPLTNLDVAGTTRFVSGVTSLTALTSDATTTDTTLNVGSTAAYPDSGILYVYRTTSPNTAEVVTYTGKTGTTFTGVTRARYGTTAAALLTGFTVDICTLCIGPSMTSAPTMFVTQGMGIGVGLVQQTWMGANSMKFAGTGSFNTVLLSSGQPVGWGSSSTQIHGNGGSSSSDYITFRTNSAERLRLDGNGYMVLGHTTANYKMDVFAGTSTQTSTTTEEYGLRLFDRNTALNATADTAGTWKSGLLFGLAQSNGTQVQGAFVQQVATYNNFSGGATKMRTDLAFGTRGDGQTTSAVNPTEKMRILHNGNVGIGTATPVTRLDVSGPTAASFTGTSLLGMVTKAGVTTDHSGIDFMNNGRSLVNPLARIAMITTASGSNLKFGTTNDWAAGGISNTAMTIDHNGYVGIGIAAPAQPLDVNGHARIQGTLYINTMSRGTSSHFLGLFADLNSGNGGEIHLNGSTKAVDPGVLIFRTGAGANAERMRVDASGNVGIGMSSGGEKLEVSGNVKATAFISTSDRRLKKDIKPVKGLSIIERLRGVSYLWRSNDVAETGVIAQEVEKVLPSAVVTDVKSGIKAVKYQNIIAPLIEAVRELAVMIRNFAQEILAVKSDVTALESRIKELELEKADLANRNQAFETRLRLIEENLLKQSR